MYLDEFCVALPFIEKSLYGNGRDIGCYVTMDEKFMEHRASSEELSMKGRVLSDARCLDPLKTHTNIWS